jgi:hypothetical protein
MRLVGLIASGGLLLHGMAADSLVTLCVGGGLLLIVGQWILREQITYPLSKKG